MKLDEAIAYMRTRNLYCLDQGSKPYTPVNGPGKPLDHIQLCNADTWDTSYGGAAYLQRFDQAIGI